MFNEVDDCQSIIFKILFTAKTAMKIFLGCAVALLIFSLLPFEVQTQSETKGPKVTHEVTFDLAIGDNAIGSVTIGLFGKTVPKTSNPLSMQEAQMASKAHRWRRCSMVGTCTSTLR